MENIYVHASELVIESYTLADVICKSGFEPDVIVAFWRGGCQIAAAVDEYLRVCQKINVVTMVADPYASIRKITNLDNINDILLVDDMFDIRSAATVRVMRDFVRFSRLGYDVKIATLCYKPDNSNTLDVPDFYIRSVFNKDVIFPYGLQGLSCADDWEEKKRTLLRSSFEGYVNDLNKIKI